MNELYLGDYLDGIELQLIVNTLNKLIDTNPKTTLVPFKLKLTVAASLKGNLKIIYTNGKSSLTPLDISMLNVYEENVKNREKKGINQAARIKDEDCEFKIEAKKTIKSNLALATVDNLEVRLMDMAGSNINKEAISTILSFPFFLIPAAIAVYMIIGDKGKW